MPQLDFSTFPSQAFWLVVSFALMWLVMAKMIVPKITDILNQRQRKIDDYLTAAGEFKQTAEEALEKYERVLREANAEAAENLRKAGEELEKKIAAREAEKSRRLAEATAENDRRTEENRRQTMEQIENIAAELAVRIAGRLELDGLVSAEDVAKTAGRRREHE